MADNPYARQIRAKRKRMETDAAGMPRLVYDAMTKGGLSWEDIAKLLDVKKARVYQLRAQGEKESAR
jgi:transposase